MNKFLNGLNEEFNKTNTINGAKAYKSTGSNLVNLFATIGSMRTRLQDVENKFIQAFYEDKLLAMKLAFYTRDIREGLGERDTFKSIIKYLAKVHPNILLKNLNLIPEFGRWDDILCLLNTEVEQEVINLIKYQLEKDLVSEDNISLLAKWLPSVSASSSKSRKLAKYIANKLNVSVIEYRKTLSKLRKKINIVESKMSKNEWKDINYSQVPSIAMKNYRNSFKRHDEKRFEEFINKVSNGESKINSSTLFPYDIIKGMGIDVGYSVNIGYDKVLEEQWKSLPNYIEEGNNVLVMADTSGSMTCNGNIPISTSIGLAIYFAQRNKGLFHNTFMTFSKNPELVKFEDNMTVYDIVNNMKSIVANTNLELALNKILNVAIKNKIEQSEMPKSLVIISDMEFDSMVDINAGYTTINNYNSFFEEISKKFNENGYEMPNVVFWNVDSKKEQYQVNSEYNGVQMVSGHSVAVFKSVLKNIGKTPYEAMLETLNNPRYDNIQI